MSNTVLLIVGVALCINFINAVLVMLTLRVKRMSDIEKKIANLTETVEKVVIAQNNLSEAVSKVVMALDKFILDTGKKIK